MSSPTYVDVDVELGIDGDVVEDAEMGREVKRSSRVDTAKTNTAVWSSAASVLLTGEEK